MASPRVVIIGAGFSGICMAARLRAAGIETFTIVEKASALGGTWRDNTYPGAACDVPSHLYSFSFSLHPDWSHRYSAQPEIEAYLLRVAREHDLLSRIRLGTEIASMRFDEAAASWTLRTVRGEAIVADVVVSAVGQLNRPALPAIPGRDEFQGPAFHSARWRHDVDLAGKNVAVVGNGASAIQFVPAIAPRAGRVTIYQRSAHWIVPRGDREYAQWERWVFRRAPAVMRAHRSSIYWRLEFNVLGLKPDGWISKFGEWRARAHLEDSIPPGPLRELLTPDFAIGCKRVLISDDYYPALLRESVEVTGAPIERVNDDSVSTADGVRRPTDVVIYATGFQSTQFLAPIEIAGRRGIRLHDAWNEGPEAMLGMTVPGFPNFFMTYGPNTNLGHNSIVYMIERQARYVVECVRALASGRIDWIDVRPEAARRFNRELQAELARTVWARGCSNWYKDASGKVVSNWSGSTQSYRRNTERVRWEDYDTGRRGRSEAEVSPVPNARVRV